VSEGTDAPPDTVSTSSRLQRRVVWLVGLLAAALAAKPGYDIGVRIASPWLGVVMALNLAFMTALLAAWLCDRLWTIGRRLRGPPRGQP
jgi:hypothetical protein